VVVSAEGERGEPFECDREAVGRAQGLGELGPTCQLTRRLLVPGGSQPDWGPARP
jgi:hypothetical protein